MGFTHPNATMKRDDQQIKFSAFNDKKILA